MPQPTASASAPKTAASPAASSATRDFTEATATEKVTRPDQGLARGVWEAPAWAFWVMLGVVVASATLYLLRRLGVLQLKKKKAS